MADTPDEAWRPVRLRFRVRAPAGGPVPLGRLAQHLHNLATLLGATRGVHVTGIEGPTGVVQITVERDVCPRVRGRLEALQGGDVSLVARRAQPAMEGDLTADHAGYAELLGEDGAGLLRIGQEPEGEPELGPFWQKGQLTGIPILIGGEGDPVWVHLKYGERLHVCSAPQELAKRMSAHLFSKWLRVVGSGCWFRDGDGKWIMTAFRIDGFKALRTETAVEAMDRLRELDGAWKEHSDFHGALRAIRHDDE